MKESIKKTRRTPALEALNEAHRLAVSPFVFQALCAMTDLGMMRALDEAGSEGLTLEALCEKSPCSDYAARSLLEVAVRFGVAQRSDEGRFSLTNTGIFFVNDLHVGINFRFTRDVCYEGLGGLTDSFRESRPAGLKGFDDLSRHPEAAGPREGELVRIRPPLFRRGLSQGAAARLHRRDRLDHGRRRQHRQVGPLLLRLAQ